MCAQHREPPIVRWLYAALYTLIVVWWMLELYYWLTS